MTTYHLVYSARCPFRVCVVGVDGCYSGKESVPPSEAEWRAQLSTGYNILRKEFTERPFRQSLNSESAKVSFFRLHAIMRASCASFCTV
jgi:hypothetical protein